MSKLQSTAMPAAAFIPQASSFLQQLHRDRVCKRLATQHAAVPMCQQPATTHPASLHLTLPAYHAAAAAAAEHCSEHILPGA
jgi:hypothetical protein